MRPRSCGLGSGPGRRSPVTRLRVGGGHPLASQPADDAPLPRPLPGPGGRRRGGTPRSRARGGRRRRPGRAGGGRRAEGGGRARGGRQGALRGGRGRGPSPGARVFVPLAAARSAPRRRCAPLEGGQGIKGGSGGRGHRTAHPARGAGHPAWAQPPEPRPRGTRPLLQSPPESETGPLQQSSQPPTPSCPGGTHQSAAAAHSCDASGTDCSAMTTARYRPTWDLALDPLVSCKLCLGEYPVEQMTTIAQCQCIFCTLCLKQYVELLIKEGLETAISCPDAACPKQGHLQEDEIECMVAAEIMQRYKKLQFEREVLLDPCRTWCPTSTCQAVCQLQDMGLQTPQLVRCKACDVEFCSACKASWHPGQGCPETMPITFLPGETSSAFKLEEDDAPIKRCPKCKVYIERDEGCAQMMCKNCKHAFCWYCLESLDDDFLLIHYDKGPCRNKLGHSRASVIWHRTQVVGIFAGFGLLLLVASPFLLLATPFVLCCKCKCSKGARPCT
uniref:RBR-type E3 ubiquitin transferase n=1 Tax=Felis catus TaxID=9685 RepID=A0ABI7VPX1_FELCA